MRACIQLKIPSSLFNPVWHTGLVVHVVRLNPGRMLADAMSRVRSTSPPELAKAKMEAEQRWSDLCQQLHLVHDFGAVRL